MFFPDGVDKTVMADFLAGPLLAERFSYGCFPLSQARNVLARTRSTWANAVVGGGWGKIIRVNSNRKWRK